jgi:hypothetical protein
LKLSGGTGIINCVDGRQQLNYDHRPRHRGDRAGSYRTLVAAAVGLHRLAAGAISIQ